MIKSFGDESVITNWLRNRNSIEFLGIWDQINNPDFKPQKRGGQGVSPLLSMFNDLPTRAFDNPKRTDGVFFRSDVISCGCDDVVQD